MRVPPLARHASIAPTTTLVSIPNEILPWCGSEVCAITASGGSVRENSNGTMDSRAGT